MREQSEVPGLFKGKICQSELIFLRMQVLQLEKISCAIFSGLPHGNANIWHSGFIQLAIHTMHQKNLRNMDMKNLGWMYWMIGLLALTAHDAVLARGGHGHGHGHHGHGHRHGHFSFGINTGGFNSGFYGPGFYPYGSYTFPGPYFVPPRYRYSPSPVVSVTPPVYIQREPSRAAQPQAGYWHYCRSPEGYYPTVKNCPDGWIPVAPQSPAP